MKFKMIVLPLVLAVFLPSFAQAKTIKFPKNNPEFTVTFPNDWKADATDGGIISAQPKGAGYALSIFPVTSTNLRDAIAETLKEVEKRFTDIKPKDPSEFKNDNRITFLEQDFTGKDKGLDRTLAIVAFSPNGKNFFALFQAGTPDADKVYTKEVVTIVQSIKSLKSSSSDDDDE